MGANKLNVAFMNMAIEFSKLSYCMRSRVGAVIVKDGNVISCGYNGTPSGFENDCECVETVTIGTSEFDFSEEDVLKTKPEVLHAESNCIAKIAKSTQSSDGSDLYVTMAPCIDCAKLIIQSGIKNVFYKDIYRDASGLKLLEKANIKAIQIFV